MGRPFEFASVKHELIEIENGRAALVEGPEGSLVVYEEHDAATLEVLGEGPQSEDDATDFER
eukprot:3497033-Heterocapsa_arctica.AAC.1